MWGSAIASVFAFVNRVWDYIANRESEKSKLKRKRETLEKESVDAQIKGNLSDLRRISNEIEDIDRKLQSLPA